MPPNNGANAATEYNRLSLPPKAASAHQSRHDDYLPGESPCNVWRITYPQTFGAATEGYFTYLGDGEWVETKNDGSEHYVFSEIRREGDWIYVRDNSGPAWTGTYRDGLTMDFSLNTGELWIAWNGVPNYVLYNANNIDYFD